MTVIARFGSDLPLFCFAIAGSFQRLILPRKRYAIDVADSAHGICTQPRHAANWSGVSGASLAPKSTVRFVIALMPPPDPIGPYVILIPNLFSTLGIHALTSGA